MYLVEVKGNCYRKIHPLSPIWNQRWLKPRNKHPETSCCDKFYFGILLDLNLAGDLCSLALPEQVRFQQPPNRMWLFAQEVW